MKPVITYTNVQQVYALNVQMPQLTPTSTGGTPAQGTKVSTYSGATNNSNYPVDGTASQTTYKFPFGVATSPDGTSYAVDEYGPIIRKITPSGTSSIFAGSYNAPLVNGTQVIEYGYADGQGTAAKFNNPRGLALDLAGNLYVTELSNRIRKITPDGLVSTLAGSGVAGFFDGTDPLQAQFKNPLGITVAYDGTVYVADTDNHKIRKIATNGAVTTVAGSVAGNLNGVGLTARFRSPQAVAVDNMGNIFVADTGNGALRKIDTAGNVTTIPVTAGFFTLSSPTGLVYSNGDLYVSDSVQNVIFKIDTLSNSTVYAGNGIGQFKDGITVADRTGASFYAPQHISADNAGNIIVADRNSQKLRKIVTQPAFTISPALPKGMVLNGATGVITGKPTVASPMISYTIIASNYDGLCYTNISFSVQ